MHYDGATIAGAELRFREGIWSTAPQDAVEELEIRKRWFGPILATICGGLPEEEEMNMIQGAAEPGAVEDGHLAAAVAWMGSHEVNYLVAVGSDRPGGAGAEAWLATRGYEQGSTLRRYIRRAAVMGGKGASAVEVRELAASATEEMSFLIAESCAISELATILVLDLPALEGWHSYAAFLDGHEVACGAMMVASGVAMLGLDATRPDARRRGCNGALIDRRLIDARRAGCHTVLAEARDAPAEAVGAAHNLQRAGFVEAGRSILWRRPSA